MSKNEAITPFLIAGLSVLFATICLMVFLTNGKSAKWVSRKIKIGGLLLGLTAIVQTGCGTNQLCYKFAEPPPPEIKEAKVNLHKIKNKIISGVLKDIHPIYYDNKGYEKWKAGNYDSTIVNEELKKYISVTKIIEAGPTAFFYEIKELDTNQPVQEGLIEPIDGKFENSSKEKFQFRINESILKGKYELKVFYKNLYKIQSFDYPDPLKIEVDSKIINIK